jgi:hypothetical protein
MTFLNLCVSPYQVFGYKTLVLTFDIFLLKVTLRGDDSLLVSIYYWVRVQTKVGAGGKGKRKGQLSHHGPVDSVLFLVTMFSSSGHYWHPLKPSQPVDQSVTGCCSCRHGQPHSLVATLMADFNLQSLPRLS